MVSDETWSVAVTQIDYEGPYPQSGA